MLMNQFIQLKSLCQRLIPCCIVEVQCTSLVRPVILRQCIVMQGKSVHKAMHPFRCIFKTGLQHIFSPISISRIGAATDFENWVLLIIISHIGLVSAVQIAVIGRSHIAAASPVLVTDTEIIHLPGFLSAVFPAQVCHG